MKAQDLFDSITQQIIDQIESGKTPIWQQQWQGGGGMPLNHEGKHYNGGNVISLWLTSHINGFASPYWLTYKQAEKLGAQVRKGVKGTHVFFYSHGEKVNTAGEKEGFHFAKCYTVFNACQIDGLPDMYKVQTAIKNPDLRDAATDAFIHATGATIEHVAGSGNYFRPSTDSINLEPFDRFFDAHGYYSTALHELTHWTGAKSRLDRDQKGKQFKTEYCFEELVAELGAAFLCASLGLSSSPREDHAAYLKHYLAAFKNDSSFLFKAASHASKAVNYLHALQEGQQETEPTERAAIVLMEGLAA